MRLARLRERFRVTNPGSPLPQSLARLLMALGLAALVASPACSSLTSGDVTLAGATNFCFGCPEPPSGAAAASAQLGGLIYTNASLNSATAGADVSVSGGHSAFGGSPQTFPAQNLNNAGSLQLSSEPATYSGQTFTLRFQFTAPSGIAGGQSVDFPGALTGGVDASGHGGASLSFQNRSRLVRYQNASALGSFVISVNDCAVSAGQTVDMTASVSQAEESPVSYVVKGYSNPGGATAVFTIVSLSDTQLCFKIHNTSSGSICGVGFARGQPASYSLASPSPNSTALAFSAAPGYVPLFNEVSLDFALISGGTFATGSGGIGPGETSAIYCVSGDFSGATGVSIAKALYVRFQSLPTSPAADTGRAQ